jgi:uncharacterized protein DUF5615
MSAIRLYVDVDATEHAVVRALRLRSMDVLTAADFGHEQFTDVQHLAFAAAEGRTIYSLNVRDYARLHSEYLTSGRSHVGVILIPRQRYSTGEKSDEFTKYSRIPMPKQSKTRSAFFEVANSTKSAH